ncbi:MAG: hypothetical protein LBE95_02400 [Holosporaceae bacterium]|jgi:hypothetical protein|nr:hypothetical protein [Holosporaceae bacterium]
MKGIGRKLEEKSIIHKRNNVPLLEMDELYTYVKKRGIKSEYGLLLIETGCALLDLRSGMQVPKL